MIRVGLEACIDCSSAGAVRRSVAAAHEGGADRVELCADVAGGGTTPCPDHLRIAREAFRGRAGLLVMIRPRRGDFEYGPAELEEMAREIQRAGEAGADGVVLGALEADRLAVPSLRRLVRTARAHGLETTFHRAFDAVSDRASALEQLIEAGIDRVLTSGTPWESGAGALEGCDRLAELLRQSEKRIEIVVGGGVDGSNVAAVLDALPLEDRRVSVHAYSGLRVGGETSAARVRDLASRITGALESRPVSPVRKARRARAAHRRFRVGVAGLSCECCTFSPATTGAEDFVVLEGEALRGDYAGLAAEPDVDLVPLLRARALPGGSIEPAFHDEFRDRLLAALGRAGPWDGLLLHLHGAAHVVGREDAEGALVSRVREAVGPKCRIVASYDLHGNLSPAVMAGVDLVTAYRTAPHVDAAETVARAGRLLVRLLRDGRPPAAAFVPVPILLPGEQTSTEWEPGARLYASIPGLIERHGLLDASLLIGYVWADEPRATASVVAFGPDDERAHEAATELARQLWDARGEFAFGTQAASVDECLRLATVAPQGPVVISDSGDNPTAGGAGDVPYVLERLLAAGAQDAVYASLADPDAVARCLRAGVGAELELSLGGKLDPVHGEPLPVRGLVESVTEAPLSLGIATSLPNTLVVLRVADVRVIVTARRTPFHRLEDFLRLGVDPRRSRLVVVKIGYLEPELAQLAACSLLALSPGAVTQDLSALPFRRIRRPVFPLDPDTAWAPPARSLA